MYEKSPNIPLISSYVPLRKIALDEVYRLISCEDENTGYQDVGPVSKAFNLLCRFVREGPDSPAFKAHLTRVDNCLWLGKLGMMMTGTDGTQLWDLGFFAQAVVETGLAEEDENKECVLGMLDWLDKAQMRENPKHYESMHRHRTKGAWAYSTPEQGYTVGSALLRASLSDLHPGV